LAISAVAVESVPRAAAEGRTACFHCGEPCRDHTFAHSEKTFCCQGCLIVHDLLTENGLNQFYDLSQHPGVKVRAAGLGAQWAYLDDPAIRGKLLDFDDGKFSRVRLQVPAIHCVACVWLLENLFRLHPGIAKSQVNFPRREVSITFLPGKITLSQVVGLLASIGYEPKLTLGELDRQQPDNQRRKYWMQMGIAGFAFGNIMLMSLPMYIGLDSFSGPLFRKIFGYLNLLFALPVLLYSASDYWRSALLSFRQRRMTLDVPIAVGLAALYAQSAYEILGHVGEGYLDSLAGLVFFLLCGRVFQHRTQERLSFDRDYKCFFPLSATRLESGAEASVAISQLAVGDQLMVRNGELLPADCRLRSGAACIDYSFVTGESEPVAKLAGDYLYAGGQQRGGAIIVETAKPVSQSYLTSLWDHEAFRKVRHQTFNTMTNRFSRWFTRWVIAVAVGVALYWIAFGQTGRGLQAFTAVLIVACPCALALAAPFTLGTAQRALAGIQVFLRNSQVLERLAQVDTIVFDKTGTLTMADAGLVGFLRAEQTETPDGGALHEAALSAQEKAWVAALVRQSTHPHSMRISQWLGSPTTAATIAEFVEQPGSGIAGRIQGAWVRLGSRVWLEANGIRVPTHSLPAGSLAYFAAEGRCLGVFVVGNQLRPETTQLLSDLGQNYELALLSGDNERERERFRELFGPQARLQFNQSPLEKLEFIKRLQEAGHVVMMVGDGLNDAGALRQSDVGVAVVERAGAFSPASDIILEADKVGRLAETIRLSRKSVRIIRLSFSLSSLYNLIGVSIAACGVLSPLIAAILMPLSSFSVVAFACGMTKRAARPLNFYRKACP
jgi:Cu+-exporting ATPase